MQSGYPSRALRTRAALLGAGLELIAERPVDAIAIDEIVAAAGVAKGSFFNHFIDKPGFSAALAHDIRIEIETQVDRANAGMGGALERLTAGMAVAAAFALAEPRKVVVLTRTAAGMFLQTHPLNAGASRDVGEAAGAGALSPEGARLGVLFWLSCCHALMNAIVAERASAERAGALLRDMARLALSGLGVAPHKVEELTTAQHLCPKRG